MPTGAGATLMVSLGSDSSELRSHISFLTGTVGTYSNHGFEYVDEEEASITYHTEKTAVVFG